MPKREMTETVGRAGLTCGASRGDRCGVLEGSRVALGPCATSRTLEVICNLDFLRVPIRSALRSAGLS